MNVILMADDVSLVCDVSYLALLGMELHEPDLPKVMIKVRKELSKVMIKVRTSCTFSKS